MRILGIDPGLRLTGYGLIEATTSGMTLLEAGIIRTDPRKPLAGRLHELHDGVRELLAEGLPDAVALEDLFAHHGFPRTAIILGHVCGVISLGAAQSGVPIEAIPPAAIKRAIVGSGQGGKRQIQSMVRALLGLSQEPGAHVGDAIAIALVALSRRGASLASRNTSPLPHREVSVRDGVSSHLARDRGGRA
jgi:crossover junction endodeoxyribonuclease RuvC